MLEVFVLGACCGGKITDCTGCTIECTFQLRVEVADRIVLGTWNPGLLLISFRVAKEKETNRHEVFETVNLAGHSRCAILFRCCCLTDTAEKVALHANVRCELAGHRIIALESEDPDDYEDIFPQMTVPDTNTVLAGIPIDLNEVQNELSTVFQTYRSMAVTASIISKGGARLEVAIK